MNLDYIEVAGFRGFRNKVRIDFGAGFTVITGRNGVGKSTICDAIEFAVTGVIGKYTVVTAAKETVSDYIWWRGEGSAAEHYVTAAFRRADGQSFVITRSRENGADKSDEELVAALCEGAVPDEALLQLCKTSILRDEWIAALSLDLTESERFELVRAALGAIEGSDLGDRAKAVQSAAESNLRRAEAVYEAGRTQLTNALTELSGASDAASRNTDIAQALQALANFLPPVDGEDMAQRVDRARRELVARRQQISSSGEAIFQTRELAAERAHYESPELSARRASVAASRVSAMQELQSAEDAMQKAENAYAVEARASEIAASLSSLLEHGEKLGLHEGHCPLCAAARDDTQFAQGIAEARARIDLLADGVNKAGTVLQEARIRTENARLQHGQVEQDWLADQQMLDRLRARELALTEFFEKNGLALHLIGNPDGLELEMITARDQMVDVERALHALEASQAVSRLASIDARVATLRRDNEGANDQLARAQAAVTAAKSIEKNVRRSASEIVDERLALISPLLNELYQRLRPHADWRTIEYNIRGDVRRFLSLKVGDDLNPQFIFSSGQRRAAGLAFLLSVHLARSWARWTTLILDDPVQHIDDFRALHLVEVLSALRQSGKQIICAVEDEALADLLCRRLVSTPTEAGQRFTIDAGEEGGARVTEQLAIPPMAINVLRGPHAAIAS